MGFRDIGVGWGLGGIRLGMGGEEFKGKAQQ